MKAGLLRAAEICDALLEEETRSKHASKESWLAAILRIANCARAIRAEAERAGDGWMPIETAPEKEGNYIHNYPTD